MSNLQGMFTTILNMSITASYVAVGVILVRILLRKAPKIFSYVLWAVVLFRLICPFSFTTAFSFLGLLNVDSQNNAGVLEYVPNDIGFMQTPTVQSGIGSLDSTVNSSLPQVTPIASVNPMQIWMDVLSFVWLAGIVVLLLYSVISYIKIKRKLLTATLVKDNIYESDQIGTAFVCGFIHPKIYVPVGVREADLSYILEHERTHIRRKDYLIKPFAFFTLILHWFNPLMWLSFALMSRDMEMSCDESVLQKISPDAKGGYSSSLLTLSVKRNGLFAANPLAFGESHVNARIKNILNYKKPTFWVIAVASVMAIVVGIGLFTNPIVPKPDDKSLAAQFLKFETEYVGDNSKVGGIISLLTFPENIAYDSFELFTDIEPYAITVNLKTDTETRNLYSGEANQQQFQDNAMIMFALIGNVEYIDFSLDDGLAPYSMQYTRGWANHKCGKDVRDFAKSKEEFGKLINATSTVGKNVEIEKLVEDNLSVILSSPKESSNPQDYINVHKNEYENFFKYGGEDALQYMLTQFEVGNAEGLRGQIMMQLCKELLGARNNVTNESLSPREWYNALDIRQEIMLPNYEYDGQDTIEKLIYDTEIERDSTSNKRGGFIIVAPKVFGSYGEEDLLKVFVTTYSARYKLYGNALSDEGGSIIPAAITYRKDNNGGYILEKYEQAGDGSEFGPSIRKYCTMPVSKKEIKGLADKILKHYGDYEDIRVLMYDNLFKHLKKNGIKDATLLTNYQGEIEFSMNNPKYKP